MERELSTSLTGHCHNVCVAAIKPVVSASSAVEEQVSTRDIEKGKEVYITYIDGLDASKEEH